MHAVGRYLKTVQIDVWRDSDCRSYSQRSQMRCQCLILAGVKVSLEDGTVFDCNDPRRGDPVFCAATSDVIGKCGVQPLTQRKTRHEYLWIEQRIVEGIIVHRVSASVS